MSHLRTQEFPKGSVSFEFLPKKTAENWARIPQNGFLVRHLSAKEPIVSDFFFARVGQNHVSYMAGGVSIPKPVWPHGALINVCYSATTHGAGKAGSVGVGRGGGG